MCKSLYVIGAPFRPVKIGVANDPDRRLFQLRTANAARLSLIAAFPCDAPFAAEAAIHKALNHCRMEGEWFDIGADEARQVIARILADRPWAAHAPSPIPDGEMAPLTAWLRASDLTEFELSRRIGVSHSTLSRARRGLTTLRLDTQIRLMDETGVSPAQWTLFAIERRKATRRAA